MCILLERITIANNAVRDLNLGANNMVFYDGVIIKIG